MKTNDVLSVGLSLISIFIIYLSVTMDNSMLWKIIGLSGGIITLIAEATYFYLNKFSTGG